VFLALSNGMTFTTSGESITIESSCAIYGSVWGGAPLSTIQKNVSIQSTVRHIIRHMHNHVAAKYLADVNISEHLKSRRHSNKHEAAVFEMKCQFRSIQTLQSSSGFSILPGHSLLHIFLVYSAA